jgi:ATP-dependent Clp protease, protease subunit
MKQKVTNKMKKLAIIALLGLVAFLIPKYSISEGKNSPSLTPTIVLTDKNLIVLSGEVNGESASAVISKANELCHVGTARKMFGGKPTLTLFVNSPGGSIQSGLEMIEALKGTGCKINTVTLFAASMGFQIVQNMDDRLILKNGVLMSHRAAGGFEGSFGGIRPSQLDSRYQFWMDRVRELDEQTVSRTKGKQTYDSYTKEYQNEMWLTGNKSVQEGYADEVVLVKCDSSVQGTSTHSIDFMGVSISYELDNCPLNTSPMNIKMFLPKGLELSTELKNEIKTKFLERFYNTQKQEIPLY